MTLETVDWYDVCGPKEAPAVILIHGSTLTRTSWKPQVDALQADYRLICPDLPGHGALAAQPFQLDTALERLGTLFERECRPSGRAVLVGISLGGHIATLLAASHPRQTAGLVISGASMNFSGLTGLWTKTIGRLMLRLNPEKMRAQAERNIRKKWPAVSAEAIIAAGLYPAGAFQSFRELPGIDFRAKVVEVKAPVLILNGETDTPNRKGETAFAAAASNARIAVIKGAGHACSIEQPERYNAELRSFLDAVTW